MTRALSHRWMVVLASLLSSLRVYGLCVYRLCVYRLCIYGLCIYGLCAVSLYSCQSPHSASLTPTQKPSTVSVSTAQARDLVDTSPWARVLDLTLVPARDYTQVRYSELSRGSEGRRALERFVASLAAPLTADATPEARLAYWINAYNALTIRHVLRFPELKSVATAVRGAPRYAFFKQRVHKVAGELRSLDEIEHMILRPQFKDSRVHAALNCASRSCPALADEPYRARSVHAQLNTAARRFVSDSALNQLDVKPLRLSKIFKWFRDDFKSFEGSTYRSSYAGITAFLKRYATREQRDQLDVILGSMGALDARSISYLEYDWSLNGSLRSP